MKTMAAPGTTTINTVTVMLTSTVRYLKLAMTSSVQHAEVKLLPAPDCGKSA